MSMRSARRLLAVAVVASLAVTGLSACRSAPAMAAYVGDVKIADTRAQAVFDEVHNAIVAAGPSAAGAAPTEVTRTEVVAVLVGAELLPEIAKQQNVSLPADVPVESYAAALSLPANTEYTRLYVQASVYAGLLLQKATGGPTPTDADLREVFDGLVKGSGGSSGDTTFEQFKGSLSAANTKAVQSALAVRQEITDAATKADLSINPRYQAASLPVLQTQLQQNGPLVLLISAPLAATDAAPVSPAH
jgi:hypothetical protein